MLRHGWNATAYQIINPGITLWFDPRGDAVVGYVRHRAVNVVAGAPVCARERLSDVARAFEIASAGAGAGVCYFGAEDRLVGTLRGSRGHSRVLLGAQPAWDPAHWAQIVARKASLRAQLNRARNKGVLVVPMSPEQATASADLRRVLAEWLATRGLPPLHFLVEPDTLERLFDRRVFVATRGADVVAFLVASPAPARNGWLVEQIVRGRDAPNGTSELLLDAAMRALAHDGFTYATLGLSPLSRHAPESADTANPPWLRLILHWVRAHGRRFYNFVGLDNFKAKFIPDDWEPVYAIAAESRFAPSMLYAIAGAFSGGSPVSTVSRALWRAVRTEAHWVADRARPSDGRSDLARARSR